MRRDRHKAFRTRSGKAIVALTRRDWIGLGAVALGFSVLLFYRRLGVEPRAWVAICATPTAPLVCAPRAALLWMQDRYVWGGAALLLGLWAFRGAPFAVPVLAVATGAAAVLSYNATWGMVGAALGAWAWITRGSGAPP